MNFVVRICYLECDLHKSLNHWLDYKSYFKITFHFYIVDSILLGQEINYTCHHLNCEGCIHQRYTCSVKKVDPTSSLIPCENFQHILFSQIYLQASTLSINRCIDHVKFGISAYIYCALTSLNQWVLPFEFYKKTEFIVLLSWFFIFLLCQEVSQKMLVVSSTITWETLQL